MLTVRQRVHLSNYLKFCRTHKLILTGCQNPAFERSLLNMHVTFKPQDFEAGCLNRAWSTLVK